MNLTTFFIPLYVNSLEGLKNVLAKAKAHAGDDEAALLDARLAPDMFPFVKQVQVATDQAKGAFARLSGSDAPVYEDTETSIDALAARIDRTIEYLRSFSPEQFDGFESRRIELKYFPGKYLDGIDYLREYALPNFFFHVTTAYAIARQQGVAIGKADFVNRLSFKDA